jgi:hypothetical protein
VSIEAMTIALHHSRARGSAKLVLLGIANHHGDGGAWPSLATLAKYAAVDPRNVRKALRELEAMGEIRTHLQAGGSSGMSAYERPNRYDFLLACPASCDRSTRHRETPPDAGIPRGRTPASSPPRTQASAEPSDEPSSESSCGPSDSGLPAGRELRPRAPKKPRKPPKDVSEWTEKDRQEAQADYNALHAICAEEGEDDPLSVWWTLRHDHGAHHPSHFMAELVDRGQWEGFVGSHGIYEYDGNGKPR